MGEFVIIVLVIAGVGYMGFQLGKEVGIATNQSRVNDEIERYGGFYEWLYSRLEKK